MRRLLLIIQLIGLSAFLAGIILGTFIVVEVGLIALLLIFHCFQGLQSCLKKFETKIELNYEPIKTSKK